MTTPTDRPRVAILGVGHVGSALARILIDAGYPVEVAASGDPQHIRPLRTAGKPRRQHHADGRTAHRVGLCRRWPVEQHSVQIDTVDSPQRNRHLVAVQLPGDGSHRCVVVNGR